MHGEFAASAASAATVESGASVDVVSHRATFTVEVSSVEGDLAVFAGRNLGAQHHGLVKRELHHSILAFRNLRIRQRVVVVEVHRIFASPDGGHEFLPSEARFDSLAVVEFVSHFDHVRADGGIKFSDDGPDVGLTGAVVDSHKLALDGTSSGGIHIDRDVGGVASSQFKRNLGQVLEKTIIRREVKHSNSVVIVAFIVHLEHIGGHPSTQRAAAHLHGVDGAVGAHDVQAVGVDITRLVGFVATRLVTASDCSNSDVVKTDAITIIVFHLEANLIVGRKSCKGDFTHFGP